jgi:hypothetical protein
MATHGRSIDDLPLAAYSTGLEPEDLRDEPADDSRQMPAPEYAQEPDPRPGGTAFAMLKADPHELSADPEGIAAPARPASASPRRSPASALVGLARRNPRLAAGAGFVAVILVGLLLLSAGGQTPASLAATASPTAPAVPVVLPPTGDASLVLTGAVQGTYAFTGGALDAAKASAFTATWTTATQDTLALEASVDRGTRTTGAGLVLRLSVVVQGVAVTFTSKAGECTVGMAVQPTTVSGSFTCKKLKSDDGTLTIGASGTYRT